MTRVTIKQGELEGVLDHTPSGKSFVSFKGIPYAKPPIGDLRFRAPYPADKWDGVRDASCHGNECTQWDVPTNSILEGSEDCLSLNVYTPKIHGSRAPVMVWFHGGGFQYGSSDSSMYGPHFLIEENVVVVSVNYRLEVLGFLCLDTEEVPGNAGLKDQVMSLRWIKDNIEKFGGDPNNVTIFGESAGGASVTYHLVSPMSRGLFHRAIIQSGTFFNEWARSTKTIDRGFRVGKFLGCDTNDVHELTKFLKSVPANQLVNMTPAISDEDEKNAALSLLFCPTVEKRFKNQEVFLPKPAAELLAEGNFAKVPIIIGYNDAEGILTLKATMRKASLFDKNFIWKIPQSIRNTVSLKQCEKFAKEMKKFYYGDKQINDDTIYNTLDMESDCMFVYGVQKFAKIMSEKSPQSVYLYKFTADCHLNFTKEIFECSEIKGASHADDLFYLFKSWVDADENSIGWNTIKRMTKMWTNFATYGDPTPIADKTLNIKWKPIKSDTIDYLEIGLDLKNGVDPDKERYDFHKNMYEQATKIKSSL